MAVFEATVAAPVSDGGDDLFLTLPSQESVTLNSPSPGGDTFIPGNPITGLGVPDGSVFFGSFQDFRGVDYLFVAAPGKLFVYANPPEPDGFLWQSPIPISAVDRTDPFTVCFLAGSLIATPAGERAVETLQPGDLVVTAEGIAQPIKWIGYQTVSTRFGAPERLSPVRIRSDALGDGLPHSDLLVSVDHAILVDGLLVHAGALVKGTSILREPLDALGDSYTFWHVELERHEVILANGLPAESFLDNLPRQTFHNYADFEARFGGEVAEMQELPLPRVLSARQLPPRIEQPLQARAAIVGDLARSA